MIRVNCEAAVELEGGKPVLSFKRDAGHKRQLGRVTLDDETARRIVRALQEVEP